MQDYTQKLHDALVKAERALCYVLGFNLEPFNSYADLYKLIKPYQLSSNCEDVPQMAWDFLILRSAHQLLAMYSSAVMQKSSHSSSHGSIGSSISPYTVTDVNKAHLGGTLFKNSGFLQLIFYLWVIFLTWKHVPPQHTVCDDWCKSDPCILTALRNSVCFTAVRQQCTSNMPHGRWQWQQECWHALSLDKASASQAHSRGGMGSSILQNSKVNVPAFVEARINTMPCSKSGLPDGSSANAQNISSSAAAPELVNAHANW